MTTKLTEDHIRIPQLTPRENDVLYYLARGDNNRRIAEATHLALSTIENHINTIFGKLGLSVDTNKVQRVIATLWYWTYQGANKK